MDPGKNEWGQTPALGLRVAKWSGDEAGPPWPKADLQADL